MFPRNGPFPPMEQFIPIDPSGIYDNGDAFDATSVSVERKIDSLPPPDAPWKNMIYDRTPIGLHMEIISFFHFIGPQKMDEVIRSQIVERIAAAIKLRFPHYVVDTFGSFKTGLFLPYSDIDIVIYVDTLSNDPLSDVAIAIQEDDICDSRGVRYIDKASIPVVKFFDKITLTPVDICCNVPNPEKSVVLVNNYLDNYPNISPLFFVLKEILCERKLNEVYAGGLPSYALFLMIVSFFQLHPRNDACTVNANVGVLLLEFFELYGCNINFEQTGIRITGGGSYVPKKDMRLVNGDVPSALYIEDPLKEGSDVAKCTFNTVLIQKLFAHCYYALDGLIRGVTEIDANPNDFSFLRSIIKIPEEFMNARRRYDDLRSTLNMSLLPSYPLQTFMFTGPFHPHGIPTPMNHQLFFHSPPSLFPDFSLSAQPSSLNPLHFPPPDFRSTLDAKENRKDKNPVKSEQNSSNNHHSVSKNAGVRF